MTGIPVTGTLTPDGSFPVVDVAHVHDAEVAGTAATAVASIPDATAAVRGMATPTQVQRIELLTRTFESFGAIGDCNPSTAIGTDDTVAVQAALTWCNGVGKAVTGSPGKVYKVTAALNTWRSFILGSRGGDKNAWAFYRPAGTAGAFLVCGGLEPAVSRPTVSYGGYGACQYATIAGFTVLGPAGCGEDCILVPFNFLNSYIDVNCFGGFTRNTFRLHRDAPGRDDWVDGYDERQGGYTIWSEIRIDTVPGFWGGQAQSVDGIHVRGYSLGTRYSGNSQSHVTHYHLEGAPSGGGIRAWVTGVATVGTYGVHCINGTVDVSGFHCEDMTAAGTQIENGDAASICAPAQPNVLVNSQGYFHVNGMLPNWTSAEKVPVFVGFPLADEFSRDSTNELFLGVPYWSGISGTQNFGSFGAADPPNQILNGDFSRWVGADGTTENIAGLVGYTANYAYKGTKCGAGCTDTTRTLGAPNCAMLEGDTNNDQEVWANFKLSALQLQQYHLGCYVFATFKAKTVDPSAVITMGLAPNDDLMGSKRRPDTSAWRFDAENGFELFTLSVQVTQDHIDHGASLILFCTSGTSSNSCYVSEVQASLGYTCARAFNRASAHTPTDSRLLEAGHLEFPVDSIPVAATDPVFGQAFISGDRALLRSPVTADNHGRSMTLTGWEYSGSTWVPQYVIASSDAQAYADFTLQETAPPYAQGRFYVDAEGVPSVMVTPNVTASLAQETLVRVKTDDGNLVDGQAVYASGGQGNHLLVKKLAAGLTDLSTKVIGLVTEPITNFGHVTTFGLVHDLDTNAYPVGTRLYTSATAGTLSSSEPPGDVDGVDLCMVTNQHLTQGAVFVHPRVLPRLSGTTANRPVLPRKGTLYWDETVNSLMIWTGAAWALAIPAGYTDILGTFDSSTATADLTYEAYRDTPLRMPWLHRSQDDAISLHYQMPHNWTLTAVEPHVRIIQGAAAGGDLVLDGRLAWSRSGVTNLPAWASWTPFRVKTTLSATQWTHTMISLGTFTPPAGALYPSASLHVWLRRPGVADSEDTYEGDKVGGPTTAANVGLEYVDCHVQVQGFGTVTAT